MKNLERVFDVKRCLENNRLDYTMYMLSGKAEHSWANMKLIIREMERLSLRRFQKEVSGGVLPKKC